MSNKAVVIGEFEGILADLTAEGKGYWNVSEDKANNTLFCAYVRGKESGNRRIDFSDIIWNHDVQPIAETLRRLGIKEFTISSAASNLFANLVEFKKFGVVLADAVMVNNFSGDHKMPALLLKVE